MENEKLLNLRAQIAELVDQFATLSLRSPPFLPGITVVPPSGKLLDGLELKNLFNRS